VCFGSLAGLGLSGPESVGWLCPFSSVIALRDLLQHDETVMLKEWGFTLG